MLGLGLNEGVDVGADCGLVAAAMRETTCMEDILCMTAMMHAAAADYIDEHHVHQHGMNI